MKIELNDQLGRKISLAASPSRIVCLNPSQTETIVALGLEIAIGWFNQVLCASRTSQKTDHNCWRH